MGTILIIIILILSAITVIFQSFYILSILSIVFRKKAAEKQYPRKINDRKVSILIPLHNSENTIDKCLGAILQNHSRIIKSIIIVIDHCNDASQGKAYSHRKQFAENGIELIILELPLNTSGKVNALKIGINFIQEEDILLIDSDIILKEDAIDKLFSFHIDNNNLITSCLIYPHHTPETNFMTDIISQDRLYRQNIIKLVKDKYSVANFPGAVGLVKIQEYKKYFHSGFLEDLTASINIMGDNQKIAILPEVLAYEIERQSVQGLFWQRTRWTIGNMENFIQLVKVIKSERKYIKKFLIMSYPIMWYLQHYTITIGIIAVIVGRQSIFFLLPLILYFFQIIISNFLNNNEHRYTALEIIIHCLLFSLIITAAFFGAIGLIIRNKKLYFQGEILYKRI